MRNYSLLALVFATLLVLLATPISAGTFSIDYDRGVFLLDNKPFNYHSGSIHYFRMHGNRWARRLEQMKGMGLNAIQYYVAWNYHETFAGTYNFDGDRNFTRFSELAWQNGLYTILRIGPYICAEWENGGFPYFVTSSNSTLRSMDATYLGYVKRWMDVLLPKVKPMLYKNGGSVLMNYGRVNSPAVNSEWGVIKGSVSATYMLSDSFILLAAQRDAIVGSSGAGLYKGNFTVPQQFRGTNAGTHLSFANWGKGILFINGNNMGRYWSVGPQISLYVDGYFLNPSGVNEVILLELFDVNRGCSASKTCYVNANATAVWTEP